VAYHNPAWEWFKIAENWLPCVLLAHHAGFQHFEFRGGNQLIGILRRLVVKWRRFRTGSKLVENDKFSVKRTNLTQITIPHPVIVLGHSSPVLRHISFKARRRLEWLGAKVAESCTSLEMYVVPQSAEHIDISALIGVPP
jgi:hypothetical protein